MWGGLKKIIISMKESNPVGEKRKKSGKTPVPSFCFFTLEENYLKNVKSVNKNVKGITTRVRERTV